MAFSLSLIMPFGSFFSNLKEIRVCQWLNQIIGGLPPAIWLLWAQDGINGWPLNEWRCVFKGLPGTIGKI
jgi:hypothetical protein